MKVERVGPPVVVDGVRVDAGDVIDVPADLARSLLEQGYESDGTAVSPMWAKPTTKSNKPKEGDR